MSYDAIVVGLGAMGSAAAYHLAARGRRVAGFDAFGPVHAHGSTHGTSRIFRHAYPSLPDYVPLVRRAGELWDVLQERSGRRLVHRVGTLAVAPAEHRMIAAGRLSAERFGVEVERLDRDALAERFPALRPPPGVEANYEPRTGYLEPEACVRAHLDCADAAGAELHHGEPVEHWAADGSGVRVTTRAGVHRAERLVLAVGPWAPEHLRGFPVPLSVERRVNVHFEPRDPAAVAPERWPVANLVVPEGEYYVLPALRGHGVKIGRHDGSQPCDPRTIRRAVDEREVAEMRAILERYLPAAAGAVKWTLTCMYTCTPDSHFVLDRHPEQPQVSLFCGCSGHGFKFASVVGEILADLVLDGRTQHDIGFLSATRSWA